ncbi:hypothetical protein NE865_01554 [Phthorimaea operculella]|nr:hypothetical protein NE865_01554 [Phthorimaea operculella]
MYLSCRSVLVENQNSTNTSRRPKKFTTATSSETEYCPIPSENCLLLLFAARRRPPSVTYTSFFALRGYAASDSEYYEKLNKRYSDSEEDEIPTISKKKPRARKAEEDKVKKSNKKPETKPPKRKRSVEREPASSAKTKKRDSWTLLGMSSDDEAEPVKKADDRIRSAYSKRVADGVVRRYTERPGDLLVEVKLYHTNELKGIHPLKRHEKAALALKYQVDRDAPELGPLREFLKRCRTQFREEGIFYADKKTE